MMDSWSLGRTNDEEDDSASESPDDNINELAETTP
jgi:hypothetical protein